MIPKEELISDEMSEKIIETAEQIATKDGAHTVTVRKILSALGITNRVFYNRFHNINDVLEIIYKNTILKVREGVITGCYDETNFFEHVMELLTNSLIISYEIRMKFNQYVFDYDSVSQSNYEWWMAEIKKLICYAKAHDLIKEVEPDTVSYAIWCFCRGYNADAVGRNLPRDEAIRNFRYSFGFLLDGLKKQPISGIS